ncbi:MAG TPA: hypothetical protein VMT99_01875 [Candidatus Paceibacterota bacterium]|nr:hypothetical protein [Candidatus Paceibacterota bacterium]
MNIPRRIGTAFVIGAALLAGAVLPFARAHAADAPAASPAATGTPAISSSTTGAGAAAGSSTSTAPATPTPPPQPVDTCAPSAADLKKLAAIQNDPTLSYADELRQELALRKQLLGQTIECASAEAQALQQSLKNVTSTGDVAAVQSELSGRLDDALNFYAIELDKLNDVGISGSQAVAKEVLAWRTGSYEPLVGAVNNFILWSKSQDLFAMAQVRMDQTSRAVSFLESAAPNADLENAFVAARASLADAMSENQSARQALVQSLPPDETLPLIQQSLSSLSDTYQQFLAVSNAIKALLPQ